MHFSTINPRSGEQIDAFNSYFDVSFCYFDRCSAPYGGAFAILLGFLDLSHSSFNHCTSTSSFDKIQLRTVGAAAFLFNGEKALCSFIIAIDCRNMKYMSSAIFYLAAFDNDNFSILSVSCSSISMCHADKFSMLVDYGFDIVNKCNISFFDAINSPLIHFGHDPSIWDLKDCILCNYSADYGFSGSSKIKMKYYVKRFLVLNSKNQISIISGVRSDMVISDSAFVNYTGRLCSINKCAYEFIACIFSHYTETWPTTDCSMTQKITIKEWRCYGKKSEKCKLTVYNLKLSILFISLFFS